MGKEFNFIEMTDKDKEFWNAVIADKANYVVNHWSRTPLFRFVSTYAKAIYVSERYNAWIIDLGDGDIVMYRPDKSWVYDNGYRYTAGVARLYALPSLL